MATVRINDVNIYYESHGSGFPLVFVYGLGGNTGMWAGQIDAFAPHGYPLKAGHLMTSTT